MVKSNFCNSAPVLFIEPFKPLSQPWSTSRSAALLLLLSGGGQKVEGDVEADVEEEGGELLAELGGNPHE